MSNNLENSIVVTVIVGVIVGMVTVITFAIKHDHRCEAACHSDKVVKCYDDSVLCMDKEDVYVEEVK